MNPLPGALLLIGHPVSHSLSPAFQNAALRHAGIALDYTAMDVPPERFADAVAHIRATHAAGNVTVPHKIAMFDACTEVTPIAERAGAVNAFRALDDDQLVGHNTDVGGVNHAVRELIGHPRGLTITLLGAGGAAAAVLAAAASWDAEVRVRSRSYERAKELVEQVHPDAHVLRRVVDTLEGADIIINATTLGMSEDDDLPCEASELEPQTAVLDLVFRPNETRWVRECRARGLRAADGREMLLEQGALAFEWWLGVPPDREVMRTALLATPRH